MHNAIKYAKRRITTARLTRRLNERIKNACCTHRAKARRKLLGRLFEGAPHLSRRKYIGAKQACYNWNKKSALKNFRRRRQSGQNRHSNFTSSGRRAALAGRTASATVYAIVRVYHHCNSTLPTDVRQSKRA